MIPNDYLEKVYAGFLGMNMGIRLGAPVEPSFWTYEKIKEVYGNITGYVKNYKNFAADDDVNGPVFFLRALYDDAKDRDLEAEDVGRAWLNYSREGIGMFWWGGYGVSTEHTAYLNLKNGFKVPHSGSERLNGKILSEQIGGQIFIDTWGLVWPGNIGKAAEYAGKAASVSHDGNGIFGARFIATCISKAFSTADVMEIIEAGLSNIPEDSDYSRVTRNVIKFHKEHPLDFSLCQKYLQKNWGYDKYLGVCHIIPNAGVCVLSLLYGEGDLARSIEIATMCGWDTDCNAGNVGTIMGVAQGMKGLKDNYRKPINDFIATSSISGYLNILDVPTFAKELALLGYRLAKEEAPKKLLDSIKLGEIYFDFEVDGSTHGFRLSDNNKFLMRHSHLIGYQSEGSLEVIFDGIAYGETSKVYYKPFYRRTDFEDERYKPTFTPKVCPRQNVSMSLYLDRWQGRDIAITPYVRNTYTKEDIKLPVQVLKNKQWQKVEFIVPDTEGAMIDEVGIMVESFSPEADSALGSIFIDNFKVEGKSMYTIDFAKQSFEFLCVTPFAHNHGAWGIEDGCMSCMSIGQCEAYAGNYYTKDISVKAVVRPINGWSHNLAFRVQGAERGYHAGFNGENKVSLIVNDFEFIPLVTVDYKWGYNVDYNFEVLVKEDKIYFYINGEELICHRDDKFKYGMFGFSRLDAGRAHFKDIEVEEL
ncbi:ADP-ribosylglycohydrolase family protein [Clostridium sp.]